MPRNLGTTQHLQRLHGINDDAKESRTDGSNEVTPASCNRIYQ